MNNDDLASFYYKPINPNYEPQIGDIISFEYPTNQKAAEWAKGKTFRIDSKAWRDFLWLICEQDKAIGNAYSVDHLKWHAILHSRENPQFIYLFEPGDIVAFRDTPNDTYLIIRCFPNGSQYELRCQNTRRQYTVMADYLKENARVVDRSTLKEFAKTQDLKPSQGNDQLAEMIDLLTDIKELLEEIKVNTR